MGRASLYKRLFRYLLRYKIRLVIGIVLSLMVSLTNLFSLTTIVPIFNGMGETGPIELFEIGGTEMTRRLDFENHKKMSNVDQFLARFTGLKKQANKWAEQYSAKEVIFILCGITLAAYFAKLISTTGALYFIGTAGFLAVRDLRLQLFEKMTDLGLETFTQDRTGNLMSRIINDVELVGRNLSVEFHEGVTNLLYIVTHLALLAILSWKMLIVALVIVPILISPVSKFASKIKKSARGQQEHLAELGAHIQEILSGVRAIRAFSMEAFEKIRFDGINEGLFKKTYRGHYLHQVSPSITELAASLVGLAFLAWGALQISGHGDLNKGEFFAFFFALIFIMRPLKQVSVMINMLGVAGAAQERIFEFLDREATVVEKPNAIILPKLTKEIRYSNISFCYPGSDQPVLDNVSFSIPKGETIALVGASGGGKSTIVELLPRFYDVTDGSISIDGVDIRDVTLKSLRRSIGFVTQSVFLFNSTVKDNIAYGNPDVDFEKIIAAAKAANAHDFIETLPEAYETPIGERGVMLSGGQRQRLSIARALLLDPPILVFDEATSNLDTESELLVQEALEKLLVGRTVLIVAHRLSTIYKANNILVIDKGKIIEEGHHEELLQRSAVYKKLYDMQFAT